MTAKRPGKAQLSIEGVQAPLEVVTKPTVGDVVRASDEHRRRIERAIASYYRRQRKGSR